MNNASTLNQQILTLADQCVKCGLCSTQCPTYRLNQDENESPRGRIALAQAFASNAIAPNNSASQHLENCLLCRRCETSCPSEVKYGELMDLTNELIANNKPQQKLKTTIIGIISRISHKNWTRIEKTWRFALKTPLPKLLNLFKYGKKALSLMPPIHQPNNFSTPLFAANKEQVFVFTGCMSHIADKQTISACINLLERCHYSVKTPNDQACCGAIAAREGLSSQAKQCQSINQRAFQDSNDSPIIFFTTGCGSKLKEYRSASSAPNKFTSRVTSITQFLLNSPHFGQLKLSPLNKKVLIFTPCSESNMLKESGGTHQLLQHIPELTLLNLPQNIGCCGASGLQMITNPQQAESIRHPTIEAILQLSPDLIVSPNYPCSLHITQGLKEKGLDIPMIHPIELILNQINSAD